MVLAFFDMDKTIFAVNSASAWIKNEWRLGHLSHWQLAQLTFVLIRYYFGITNIEGEIRTALIRLKGESDSLLSSKIEDFYEKKLKHLYRPGALAALEKHRKLGHRLVLLTSSFYPLAKLVKRDLSLDECLCTRLEINDQGLYTGQSLGPLCYGLGKVSLAQDCADQHQTSLLDCFFYSDSITDLPMFQKIGHPVAVNPDIRLLRRAQKQKWQIVNWGIPTNVKT